MGGRTRNRQLYSVYSRSTRYPTRCAICWIPTHCLPLNRWPPALELAHIVPRSRGFNAGQVIGNVLLLCASCHHAQHNGGELWPEVTEGTLLLAKEEYGELDVEEVARIDHVTPAAIRDRMAAASLDQFRDERKKWGGE